MLRVRVALLSPRQHITKRTKEKETLKMIADIEKDFASAEKLLKGERKAIDFQEHQIKQDHELIAMKQEDTRLEHAAPHEKPPV